METDGPKGLIAVRYVRAVLMLACGLLLAGGLTACGSTTTTTTTTGGEVSVVITSPTSGSVIAGNSVAVRGTVSPPTASVQVQGKPAAVGNGIFTAAAELHGGKTTIDVIGSAAGETPGSTSAVVVQPSSNSSSGGPTTSTSNATPSTSGATPQVAHEQPGNSADQTPCGGQLAVGPDTSCSFAENVRAAYEREGPGTYEVFSPVTEKTYSMTCPSATPVVCTGANNASVYFP